MFDRLLSIPGVASGKLVYKYRDGNDAVFVLQTFERYVEARTASGNTWEVILDDGTRYQFRAVSINTINAPNQRTSNLLEENDDDEPVVQSDAVLPKVSYTAWYCTKIYHRNYTGSINFDYDFFGCFDFFEELTNPSGLVKVDQSWFENTPGLVAPFMKVCRDIYIREIWTEGDKLVFKHKSISVDEGENMIDLGDDQAERLDSMYTKIKVFDWSDGEHDFSSWKRYLHIKSDEANGFSNGCGTQSNDDDDTSGRFNFQTSTNPYLGRTKNGLFGPDNLVGYPRKQNTSTSEASLKHSFVESAPVTFTEVPGLVPGDLYKLEVKISSTDDCTWDINLVTGDHHFVGGEPSGCPILHPNSPVELYNGDYYRRTRQTPIFSTFNQAIKWHTQPGLGSSQEIEASNMFTMPNLATTKFQKFYLQIGPGISDNLFGTPPGDVFKTVPQTTYPEVRFSNAGYKTQDPINDLYSTNYPLKSGDPIAQNFGAGLSWFMLENFYGPGFRATEQPIEVQTWWKSCPVNSALPSYPNTPTRATEGSKVTDAELYRIAKNPYMLDMVEKQVHNPGVDPSTHTVVDNWVVVGRLKLGYAIEKVDRYASSERQSDSAIRTTEYKDKRNVILLKHIKQLPFQDIPGNFDESSAPTTHFYYGEYERPAGNSNINSDYFVLDKVVDPLGRETSIAYLPLEPVSLLSAPPPPTNGKSYSLPKILVEPRFIDAGSEPEAYNTNMDCSYDEAFVPAANYAFQTYMVVQLVTVQDRDAALPQVWEYTFTDPVMYNDVLNLGKRFHHDQVTNLKVGYKKCTILGPENNGKRLTTKHYHKTNEIPGYLLWGKLYKTEELDAATTPKVVNSTESEYEVVLAFEPIFHRGYGNHSYDNDYGDYFHYDNGVFSLFNNARQLIDPVITSNTTIASLQSYYSGVHGYNQINNRHEPLGNAYDDNIYIAPESQLMPQMGGGSGYETSTYIGSSHGLPDFAALDEQSNPFWANSYFIKKTLDKVKRFEVTADISFGTSAATEIETITEYTYFDADYAGRSKSPGYGTMGRTKQGDHYYLFWEPSWQLHSTLTWSPQMGPRDSAYAKTEVFHFYDLVNKPEYLTDPANHDYTPKFATGTGFQWLYRIWAHMQIRNMPYETRTTVKIRGNETPLRKSEYTFYKTEWEASRAPIEWNHVVDPDPNAVDPWLLCDPDPTIFNGNPNPPQGVECKWRKTGDSPPDGTVNCDFYEPYYYCNCQLMPQPKDDPDPVSDLKTYVNGNAPASPWNDPDVQSRNVVSLEGMIYPYKVLVQVQEATNNGIMTFDSGNFDPQLPPGAQAIAVEQILQRNLFGQVTQVLDAANVLHGTDYGVIRGVEFKGCKNGERYLEIHILNNHIGLPIRTWQVGVGHTDTLITSYTYHPNNAIETLTDPTGTEMSFTYDMYGRMQGKLRNGTLLQEAAYHQWENNMALTFAERANQNYVETRTYVGNGDLGGGLYGLMSWSERAYVDPLGRKVGLRKDNIMMQDAIFDRWNNPSEQIKPHIASVPTITPASPLDVDDVMSFTYETRPGTRVLKASKYGLVITTSKAVSNNYWHVSAATLDAFLATAGLPSAEVPRPHGERFSMTRVKDEDGNYVLEFTDAFGRKVASIGKNEATATVFQYDRHGNVSRVINPKKQVSDYHYNYLNKMYKRVTPDDGTTLYAYDIPGRQIAVKDNRAVTRLFAYDHLGRMTKQIRSTASSNTGQIPLLFGNNGAQWLTTPNNHLNTYNNLLVGGTARLEKRWSYDNYNEALSLNLATTNIQNYLNTSGTNLLGRLVATWSYNTAAAPKPVEIRYFSYTDDGFVKWEINQFNYNGIIPSAKGITMRFDFQQYTRTGNVERLDIDLDCNQTLDFQYYYAYDSWNRLKTVWCNFEHLGESGFKIADLEYDNLSGMVRTKKYYDHASASCKNQLVQTVSYTYDHRFRLSKIGSELFDWEMKYDNAKFSTLTTGWTSNYNGNINSTRALYKLQGTEDNPAEFGGDNTETFYNHTYDELNRLTRSECRIGKATGNLLFNPKLGDSWFAYDAIGNITQMQLHTTEYGNPDLLETFDYLYPTTDNRLHTVQRLVNGTPVTNRTIGYDANGNITSDSKRQLSAFSYGRANLPFSVSRVAGGVTRTTSFLYAVDDNRIFKKYVFSSPSTTVVNNAEFYLRTATGQDFAILDFVGDKLTWFVSAGERIARLEHPATEYGDELNVNPPQSRGAMHWFPSADFSDDSLSLELMGTPLGEALSQVRVGTDSLRLPATLILVDSHDWRLDSLQPGDVPLDTLRLTDRWQMLAFSLPDSTEYLVPLEDLLGTREPVEAEPVAAAGDIFLDSLPPALAPPPEGPVIPQPVFYLYDHLGNTRITFHADVACTMSGPPDVTVHLDYVGDYYPYGRALREYYTELAGRERYLTTQHERDRETGLDNRGARWYDADLGRFLSIDPLAAKYFAWSTYNYVNGNPISTIDPYGTDTIVVHRGALNSSLSDENTNVWNIRFSLISNGVETGLKTPNGTNEMYMFGNREADQEGDNFLTKPYYTLSFEPMPSHPNWQYTVRITKFGVFIHYGRNFGWFSGCKGLCSKYSKNSDGDFEAENPLGSLEQLYELYKRHESNLTGSKFILKTNSDLPTKKHKKDLNVNNQPFPWPSSRWYWEINSNELINSFNETYYNDNSDR